jgi:hypothetical protein
MIIDYFEPLSKIASIFAVCFTIDRVRLINRTLHEQNKAIPFYFPYPVVFLLFLPLFAWMFLELRGMALMHQDQILRR